MTLPIDPLVNRYCILYPPVFASWINDRYDVADLERLAGWLRLEGCLDLMFKRAIAVHVVRFKQFPRFIDRLF